MLEPCYSRVLLKREPVKQMGSIHIPDEAAFRHAELKCEIVAIGPDVNDPDRSKTTFAVGETVIIGQHAGNWLDENGNLARTAEKAVYYLVQDEDILAKVV